MPDPQKRTVSASQASALFNQNPYFTRWMLWQHFRRDLSLEPEIDERIYWGMLLQDDILAATARNYHAEIAANLGNEYTRNGQLGATLDGRILRFPDRGRAVIEAKNIDWLRWRDTWSQSAAALHVEVQLQTQMLVDGADYGIIAALVGGNEMRFYEREPNREVYERLREEAATFFESLANDNEPDPLGSELELPMLALLYPEVVETKLVEDLSEDMAIAIRSFDRARADERYNRKLKEQNAAIILARSGDAGLLVADGYKCRIKKSPISESICQPHTEPKILRRESVQTRIKVERSEHINDGELREGLERYLRT